MENFTFTATDVSFMQWIAQHAKSYETIEEYTMADFKMAKEVNKYMKQFTADIFPLKSKSNTI